MKKLAAKGKCADHPDAEAIETFGGVKCCAKCGKELAS